MSLRAVSICIASAATDLSGLPIGAAGARRHALTHCAGSCVLTDADAPAGCAAAGQASVQQCEGGLRWQAEVRGVGRSAPRSSSPRLPADCTVLPRPARLRPDRNVRSDLPYFPLVSFVQSAPLPALFLSVFFRKHMRYELYQVHGLL
jgi:hypothetical protein